LKDELLKVRREMDSMNAELEQARRRNPPAGSEELAQGSDRTSIIIEFEGQTLSYEATWEEIIRSVLPRTLGAGTDDDDIVSTLASLAREHADPGDDLGPVSISRSSFSKVINQMVALGLIEGTPHPLSPAARLWRATPYGVQEGCRLVAVRRKE
jgi:hypothetical protein